MSEDTIPVTLPPHLYKFFWDTSADRVNPRAYPHYVINRLLDKGDLAAARWVLKSFPKETIVETFKIIRDFSPWNGVFWSTYLGVPREEVKCLTPSYLTMRKQLWPF